MPSLNFGLSGKILLVTGGGSGIGRSTVLAAARDGCKVGIADIKMQAAETVAAEVAAMGGSAFPVAFDVADPSATRSAIEAVERELGPITLVVTSAGVSNPFPAERMSPEQWNAVINTNLNGTYHSLQIAGANMVSRKSGGAMVAISSVDGMGGHAGRSNYSASKFGVIGTAKSLAIEWGRHGVRVNAVAPGVVDTPLLRRNIPQSHVDGVMLDRAPLGRFCQSDEVASACLFLLSDAASYITGTVLTVDGGLTAGFFTHDHGADYGSNALAALK